MTVRRALPPWLVGTAGFAVLYYMAQLVTLVVRFGHWPNYVTLHDWPGNVARILRSTPAWSDVPDIVADEWLLEIGRLNHDYGAGIAEWSLAILPAKLALALAAGGLLSAVILLARAAPGGWRRDIAGVAAAFGTGLAALTGVTVTWVVCCAAPTWVVGLAILGLGVGASFALVPLGPWLSAGGFALLALAAGLLLLPTRTCPAVPKSAPKSDG